MNNFQFGQFVYRNQGLGNALLAANNVGNSYGLAAGLTVAGGAVAPFVGPALAVASTLYGAKQIYDGLKGYF